MKIAMCKMKLVSRLTILTIGLCITKDLAEGGTKTWRQSVSLGNPAMWREGRLPCSEQTIILPENEVVFMPHTFTVGSDMVFPENGMILFPSSGKLISTTRYYKPTTYFGPMCYRKKIPGKIDA